MNSFAAFSLLAASRTNPAIKDLGMCVGLGLFVAAISVALIYFGAKKRGQAMDGAFYQKLAMYGVVGLVCGFFAMRVTIKNNPELFREKPPLSHKQIENITKNPLPQTTKPKLVNPLGTNTTNPPPKRTPQQEEELKQQAEARRLEREARMQKMQQEAEERQAKRRAELEASRAAEEARKQKDMDELLALSIEELRQVRDEREREKKAATEAVRATNGRDSGATREERQAASKRFSAAVGAYMAASKALSQKESEARQRNR